MRVLRVVALLCLALAQVELASVAGKGQQRQLLKQSLSGHRRVPPPPPRRHNKKKLGDDYPDVTTHWFTTQLLDHFDVTNDARWSQVSSGGAPR